MLVAKCYSTFSNAYSVPASIVFLHFIVAVLRGNNIFAFYRRRAARKQYLCRFIVAVQRGNNIYAVLSSPCGAETISLPFYRRRAARKQYFCHFIVAVRRGNNIYAVLRRRAARKQYFCISSFAALLRALKFLFSSLQNGGTCWNGRCGACVPARMSAQRRCHPKMRRCHPQTLQSHPRMMHFHVQTRCFYPRKAPPNDGCALAGRAGRHIGTATTTLDDYFGHVPAKSFII